MSTRRTGRGNHVLNPGAPLGRYDIISFIAAGGMGEIYRARDTELGRDVAVKVLSASYVSDPDRQKRFENEARAIILLNHPNTLTVYDVGKADGLPYIVTELLHGQTLKTVLERKQLSIPTAVSYAIQVTRGLAAAHEKGIIHRDLKPGNIFITDEGHVKIVDFGLAKLLHPEWETGDDEEDTISAVSQPGAVLGSVGYMSPEQVQGIAADHRADIFSFGAILYEMLTGHRAFDAESHVETMHSILKDPPDRKRLAEAGIRQELVSIVIRCLAKKPEERFQSARDLGFALSEVSKSQSDLRESLPSSMWTLNNQLPDRRRAFALVLLLVISSVLAAISIRPGLSQAPDEPYPIVPFSGTIGYRATYDGLVDDAAISPDGEFVAYVTFRKGPMSLRLLHPGSGSDIELVPGREGRYVNVGGFSPDGNSVEVKYYYETPGTEDYFTIPLLGGASRPARPEELRSFHELSPTGRYLARTERGRIETSDGIVWRSSIVLVDLTTGTSRILASFDDRTFIDLAWAPDGSSIISSVGHPTNFKPVRVDLGTGAIETIDVCPSIGRIINLATIPDGSGLIATTDPRKNGQIWFLTFSGDACRQLTNDQLTHNLVGITEDSRKVATLGFQKMYNLWHVPIGNGIPQRITSGVNAGEGEFGLATTPGGEIVYSVNASGYPAGNRDLWLTDLAGNRRPLIQTPRNESSPMVTPDGTTVIYQAEAGEGDSAALEIWRVGIDGDDRRQLTEGGRAGLLSVSSDGLSIYYSAEGRLIRLPISGGEPENVTPEGGCEFPAPSPDGTLVSCLDVTTTPVTERVMSLSTGEARHELEFPRGGSPTTRRWAPDGRSIFYIVEAPDSTANIWKRDLLRKSLEQVTDFESDLILSFDWMPDRASLICSRGASVRDVFINELEKISDR